MDTCVWVCRSNRNLLQSSIASSVFITLLHNLTSTAIIYLNITFMQISVILCRPYTSLYSFFALGKSGAIGLSTSGQ